MKEGDKEYILLLWKKLHEEVKEDNCWPEFPSMDRFNYLLTKNCWTVVEEDTNIIGFSFWKKNTKGNVCAQGIGAFDEDTYLRLVLYMLEHATEYGYGHIHENRKDEILWFKNIGATIDMIGFEGLDIQQENRYRDINIDTNGIIKKLEYKVIIPVKNIINIKNRISNIPL